MVDSVIILKGAINYSKIMHIGTDL